MEQRARAVPYGWIGFFVLLAVVAFIGLSRHHDAAVVTNPAGPLYTAGGSAQDQAESADVQAAVRTMTSPVDVASFVRAFVLRADTLTVTVDGPSFGALSTDDKQHAFDEIAAQWSRAYRAHHGGALDRALTFDVVDGGNELVHHRLIEPS